MHKGFHPRLPLLSLALLWTMLACSPCGWLSRSGANLPDRPIEITEDAAQRFEEKLHGAWESQGEGQFRLQFTDQELTSYINLKLNAATNLPLSEPRVWLTRGKIYVSGELSSEELPLSGQAMIVTTAQVVDERVRLSIDQASIGRVPIPRAFLESLEGTVNSGLAQAQLGIKVQRLEILEGEAIIIASRD